MISTEHKKFIERLYKNYRKDVYRYAYAKLASKLLADEVVSEVYFRLIQDKSLVKNSGKHTKPWVIGIAKNVIFEEFRVKQKQHLLTHLHDDVANPQREDETILHHNEILASFRHELSLLAPETREIVELRIEAGLKFLEIAQLTAKQEDYVKKKFYRAMENIRATLRKKHGIKILGVFLFPVLWHLWAGVAQAHFRKIMGLFFIPKKRVFWLSCFLLLAVCVWVMLPKADSNSSLPVQISSNNSIPSFSSLSPDSATIVPSFISTPSTTVSPNPIPSISNSPRSSATPTPTPTPTATPILSFAPNSTPASTPTLSPVPSSQVDPTPSPVATTPAPLAAASVPSPSPDCTESGKRIYHSSLNVSISNSSSWTVEENTPTDLRFRLLANPSTTFHISNTQSIPSTYAYTQPKDIQTLSGVFSGLTYYNSQGGIIITIIPLLYGTNVQFPGPYDVNMMIMVGSIRIPGCNL